MGWFLLVARLALAAAPVSVDGGCDRSCFEAAIDADIRTHGIQDGTPDEKIPPEPGASWLAVETDRSIWAMTGWQQFRWGMGPADVAKRLPGVEYAIGVHELFKTQVLVARLKEPIYGHLVDAYFHFRHDRLVRVMLGATDRDPKESAAAGKDCFLWEVRLLQGLRSKYGEGDCGSGPAYGCTWDHKHDGLFVGMSRSAAPGDHPKRCTFMISYVDTAAEARDANAAARAITDEAKSKL